MEVEKSKVYVQTDEYGIITRCEGGYTTPSDLSNWIEIDEGIGDKYNLCQSNYFENGLYTSDGIPRYKLENGKPVERSEDEINEDRLPNLKYEKILKSKSDLQNYLANNPILWSDGEYYGITSEKQQWLTGKLVAAQAASSTQQDIDLTWNSVGEVCKPWTLEELTALGLAIEKRVTALVTYQQKKEKAISSASSVSELESITVNYDEVE